MSELSPRIGICLVHYLIIVGSLAQGKERISKSEHDLKYCSFSSHIYEVVGGGNGEAWIRGPWLWIMLVGCSGGILPPHMMEAIQQRHSGNLLCSDLPPFRFRSSSKSLLWPPLGAAWHGTSTSRTCSIACCRSVIATFIENPQASGVGCPRQNRM